jgi:aryl-alcohol dehydrogenase-like predicted oxidoreductase
VNNWDVKQTVSFVEMGFDIVSTQVQYSLLDHRPANGLARWCAENDIKLLCYGSLAGGFLTEHWLDQPDPGFVFENRSLIKYRLIVDEFGGWDLFQTLLTTVKALADKHGVSMSAVAARYVLDQPQVGAVIIGARYAHHLPQTLSIFELSLDPDDYATLEAVLAQRHGPSGYVYELESDRTGRHGSIMKYNLNAS